ncbi:carbohydrate kinase [Oceanobacillus arenosus]|uniref:Carbohydrate kinase n=1 Tax=Oceanobacillus arenosus TaxID=1229153 RepID=A0A3D8Q159_9BACI|nr:carbohydrate kinase [Oceanobacillus arenosus]RDW21149.1 carbohydrate kinase [Oceanobacillus arenosus]
MDCGIISYGEAMVDYIAKDTANSQYETFIGGTTLNAAVGACRLGTPVYYLCKLGRDSVSQFIKTTLGDEKVNLDFSAESDDKKICGVYVHVNEEGERYFHSYVNDTPDEQLVASELNEIAFRNSSIFYFGSVTLFHPIAYETTLKAIELAEKHKVLIAFDANIRIKRWESEEACRMTIKEILPRIDILKLTVEELLFLMRTPIVEEGIEKLASFHIPFIWITLGGNGALSIHQDKVIHVEGEKVKVVDTTGAGDAFMAGLLHCIHTRGLPKSEQTLIDYTQYGNKLGAMAVTKQGALTAFQKRNN